MRTPTFSIPLLSIFMFQEQTAVTHGLPCHLHTYGCKSLNRTDSVDISITKTHLGETQMPNQRIFCVPCVCYGDEKPAARAFFLAQCSSYVYVLSPDVGDLYVGNAQARKIKCRRDSKVKSPQIVSKMKFTLLALSHVAFSRAQLTPPSGTFIFRRPIDNWLYGGIYCALHLSRAI